MWAVDNGVAPRVNRTGLRPDRSCEPVIPALETPMRLSPINVVVIVLSVILRIFAEPAIRFILIHILQGQPRRKHNVVVIEDAFQVALTYRLKVYGKFIVRSSSLHGVGCYFRINGYFSP